MAKAEAEIATERAKTAKYNAEAQAAILNANVKKSDVDQKGYQIGAQVHQMITGEQGNPAQGEIQKALRNNDPTRRSSV